MAALDGWALHGHTGYTILYYTILYHTIHSIFYTLYSMICTIIDTPYYTIIYYTILYCTVLYRTVLYYAVLYCTVLYCTILGLLSFWLS